MTLLTFADDRPFAHGACFYRDQHPLERSSISRMVLSIKTGSAQVLASVDTGGAYFVCDPDVAKTLGLSSHEAIGTEQLIIRGIKYSGDLYRVDIQFLADAGTSLNVDVTAFIPRLRPGDEWHFPSFLGLQGCLEFIRFAVDPASNTFFFGPAVEG